MLIWDVGKRELVHKLRGNGLDVTPVDVSKVALESVEGGIEMCLPYLKLPEEGFDLVVCTDVLAEIDESLQRLSSRKSPNLMKREGMALISSPLDVQTIDPLGSFLVFLQMEFEVVSVRLSYYRLGRHKFFEWLGKTLFGEGGVLSRNLLV